MAASMNGVFREPNGLQSVDWRGMGMSETQFTEYGYNGAPSTAGANGYANPQSGGRRRSRKTRRRHRRRSMRGGTGGEGSGYGFSGRSLTDSGPGVGARLYEAAGTGNHTVDANGYNGGHP